MNPDGEEQTAGRNGDREVLEIQREARNVNRKEHEESPGRYEGQSEA